MTDTKSGGAHLIAGGFPRGSTAGHDHDYARLRLLSLLAEQDVAASLANDFADVEKWLSVSRLLITYVAGPYPDAAQCRTIRSWLEAGGHWLGLHGTSGGRAERVEGSRQRRTVKTEHHALLGSYFLTHPPICKIHVDVRAGDTSLTRGLGASFDVEDEPYFIELQDPGSTRILLTADYGPDATSPTIGTLYPTDTSLQPDGKTRVLGYTREMGKGGVTYVALGHCHNPAIRASRAPDPTDTTPLTFRGSWETDAFNTLLGRLLARRGLEPGDEWAGPADGFAEASPMLAGPASVSVRGRIALGPRAGALVRRLGQPPGAPAVGSRGPRTWRVVRT